PHNKKLLSKMPAVLAPPGVKTRQPFSTFYQVFVSGRALAGGRKPGAMPGMGMAGGAPGGPGMKGGAPGMPGMGMAGGAPGMGGGAGMGRPPGTPGGMQGGAPGGGPPGAGVAGAAVDTGPTAAFIKGEPTYLPASFVDGTSNTILIVEAGNSVPWT